MLVGSNRMAKNITWFILLGFLSACQARSDRQMLTYSYNDPSSRIINLDNPAKSQNLSLPCDAPHWAPTGNFFVCSDAEFNHLLVVDDRDMTILGTTTSEGDYENFGGWSPDGKSMVIQADINGGWGFFILDVLEEEKQLIERQLDLVPGIINKFESWSPDGKNILYRSIIQSDDSFENPDTLQDDLVIITSEGNETFRIDLGTINGYPWGNTPNTPVATWSPDNSQLGLLGWQLLDIRSGEITELIDRKDVSFCSYYPPAWSPAGDKLLFRAIDCSNLDHAYSPDSIYDIYTINIDGSGLTKLTEGLKIGYAGWSPDGDLIVIMQYDGDWDIYVMNSDGSSMRCLTENNFDDYFVQWLIPDR